MDIYDWDMKVKKYCKECEGFYTNGKVYKVRGGRIKLDIYHDGEKEIFNLSNFINRYEGDWEITSVKVLGRWYSADKI